VTADLRVVRGDATAEEIAALVAALALVQTRAAADAKAAAERRTPSRSLWARPARNIRPPMGPGPGAWRASGLPR
jgi:Acyl-CoA carboxylase epsilon subunit